MSLPSSGAISLGNLQTIFGGANPIGFNEYYLNATPALTAGVSGIPNIGSAISLNQFYGKSKNTNPPINYMLAGNIAANMSGGNAVITSRVDDNNYGIGTVGTFFWFGNNWGASNNVQWCTNGALTFGGGSNSYSVWSAGTARGVLLGQSDRMTNWLYQSDPPTPVNNHTIKRFIVNQTDYNQTSDVMQHEIRLIRGPTHQYIEIRFGTWSTWRAGQWNLSDGGSFYNVFSGSPPIGTNQSLVIRGDLNGYNWQVFNNHYMNL
jgi:hypothetical protein